MNLVPILLTAPFESASTLTTAGIPSFSGYDFVFDRRPTHTTVTILLELEMFFMRANGAL